ALQRSTRAAAARGDAGGERFDRGSRQGDRDGPGPGPASPAGHSYRLKRPRRSVAAFGLLQGLEAQAMGLRSLLPQPLPLVLLVLVVVALVEEPARVAFGGEDVRADAIEEPAIVRDHHH